MNQDNKQADSTRVAKADLCGQIASVADALEGAKASDRAAFDAIRAVLDAPLACSAQVATLVERLESMGVTNLGFTAGPNATPDRIAGEIMRALDQLEAAPATGALVAQPVGYVRDGKDGMWGELGESTDLPEGTALYAAPATSAAAPADRLDEALANFLAEHTRLNQDGIDSHSTRMALALNYAALNPVPEADIEEWREQGYLDAAEPADLIALAVRDVCELDYSGEDHIHDNLLSVTVEDLLLILNRHFATHQPTPTGNADKGEGA